MVRWLLAAIDEAIFSFLVRVGLVLTLGGGSEQSNKFEPPPWTSERYPAAMTTLDELVQRERPMYAGQRIAEFSPLVHGAGQLTVDRALYGNPQTNAARSALMSISQGGASNPFMDNAYTEQMIGDTARDMTDAYSRGTAATNDALAAMSGAFGGDLHQQKSAIDAGELSKRVGQMGTSTRQGEIVRRGNLWDADVGRTLQAAGMAPQFELLDQDAFDRMASYGREQRGYLQSLLDDRRGEWQEQQDYPFRMLDYYLNKLGQGSGQYGQNYQTTPGASPWSTAAGLGMGAYGLSQMGLFG